MFEPSRHSPPDTYGVALGPSFDAGVTTSSPTASSVIVKDVTGADFTVTKDAVIIMANKRSYPVTGETGAMMIKNLLDVKGNNEKMRSVLGTKLDMALAKVTAMTSAQQAEIQAADRSIPVPQPFYKKPLFWVGTIAGLTVITGTIMFVRRMR